MIKLPNWLTDRRLKSLLSGMDITEVELFHWKNENEAPSPIDRVLDKDEFDLLLKGGIPIVKGKVQIFYIKDQYIPLRYSRYTSRFKYHLTKCGSIIKAENRGDTQRFVVTNKLSTEFKVNLVDSDSHIYEHDALIKMHVCKSCLIKMGASSSPVQLKMPKAFNDREEWSRNFDLKEYFQSAQSKLFGTQKSPVNQSKQPLPLKKNDVNVEKLDLRPRTTEKIDCDECGLAYPEQLRAQFKHFKTTDHESICIKCYAEKYQQLPEGVNYNHLNIARNVLRILTKPKKFEVYKVRNVDTQRIMFLGFAVGEKSIDEKHPEVKKFTGNRTVNWETMDKELEKLKSSKKGQILKLYSQEIKVLDILK